MGIEQAAMCRRCAATATGCTWTTHKPTIVGVRVHALRDILTADKLKTARMCNTLWQRQLPVSTPGQDNNVAG